MGKNNRQRRADKRRHQARAQSSRGFRPSGGGRADPTLGLDLRDLAEALIFDAAEASYHSSEAELGVAVRRLMSFGPARGRRIVGTTVSSVLVTALRCAWEGGWQPADVVRAAGKLLPRKARDLAAEAIGLEAETSCGPGVAVPAEWLAQLEPLGTRRFDPECCDESDSLTAAITLVGLLHHLPVLPCLIPPPSEWGSGERAVATLAATHDSKVLTKVRALLAKAESTEFEEEAGALTAKAQELMARHAIDAAILDASAAAGDVPCGRRIGVEDPYAVGKANLLSAVARANRCEAVFMEPYGFSTVMGFPSDIDIVELLYTSLLVQATRAIAGAGSVRDRNGRSRTRSFRQSFLIGFARRIGERLRAATEVATDDARAVHGNALLPVLARRDSAVGEAFAATFPGLVNLNARVTNSAGWAAGRVAADLAHLGPEQQLLPGMAV